ncbi:hypothetical protein BC834DRAFT_847651 [Gloeopeniophorella convolvens]|nr:hypothetical protein BC834DRAFT_847651 [Gloeopeniophorella convolvens]
MQSEVVHQVGVRAHVDQPGALLIYASNFLDCVLGTRPKGVRKGQEIDFRIAHTEMTCTRRTVYCTVAYLDPHKIKDLWHTLMGGEGGLSFWGNDNDIEFTAHGSGWKELDEAPGLGTLARRTTTCCPRTTTCGTWGGDLGPENMFEATLRGGHRGEDDADEFAETMVLMVLST